MNKPLTDAEITDLLRVRRDQPHRGEGFLLDRALASIEALRAATPIKCRWCGHPIYRQRTGWTHGPHRDSRRSCCNGQRVAEPGGESGTT
jgi:hypothetical protein